MCLLVTNIAFIFLHYLLDLFGKTIRQTENGLEDSKQARIDLTFHVKRLKHPVLAQTIGVSDSATALA